MSRSAADSGESGATFRDLPAIPTGPAGKLPSTQMAAVAALEADLISQRTKAALTEAKRRVVKPGNPRLRAGDTAAARIAADAASTRSKARAADVPPFIHRAHLSGQASSVRTQWIPHPSHFPDTDRDGKPAAPGPAAPLMELLLQTPTLSFPLHRKRRHQHWQRHFGCLPPIQDRLHDLWRQQCRPRQRAERVNSRIWPSHHLIRTTPAVLSC